MLEVGQRADVVVIRPDVFWQPTINPWSTVVVQSSRSDVTDVIVDGVIVKRDDLLAVDKKALGKKLIESHERIMRKVEASGGLNKEVALSKRLHCRAELSTRYGRPR